jgi:16S rRNA (uracil1498-N3)-methyltransferase
MHRLLVESRVLDSSFPELGKAALNHLKVLRLKTGEAVELFDGCGATRAGRWEKSRLAYAGDVVRHPRPRPLTLFACITKGSRWDWTVEKAVELGVSAIVPVVSERTIVRISRDDRAAKRERWLRIAEEAARQSDAKWLPEIAPIVDFGEAVEMVKRVKCFVGALTSPRPPVIGEALEGAVESEMEKGVAVFVGPEGDFSPEELNLLLKFAVPVSFGTNVLRAETAAIYAVSAVKTRLDMMESVSS